MTADTLRRRGTEPEKINCDHDKRPSKTTNPAKNADSCNSPKAKKSKPANFTEYIYDISPGCYLTDYGLTALNFYYAVKYYYKYIEYPEQTDYLLNKQMLCQFCIFYNIFIGLSTLSCGLVHQFFYDQDKITSTIFWSLGQCLIGICVVFNGFFPLFLIYEVTSVTHYRVILGIAFAAAITLGVEELIWEKFTYGVLCLFGVVCIGLVSLIPTLFPRTLLDMSMQFDAGQLYVGIGVMLAYTIYYLRISENCRTPQAFANKMCPFPDKFNHNAVLHVVTAFCYWAINNSFLAMT